MIMLKCPRLRPIFLLLFPVLSGGCVSLGGQSSERTVLIASRTEEPIELDGKLLEPVWARAAVYEMTQTRERIAEGKKTQEAGRVRIAWDDEHLYVAYEFDDSDLLAEGQEDQLHHYQLGDVAELFLRPVKSRWYWELYVTPHNLKAEFFFPSSGHFGLPSCFENYRRNLRVSASVDGTLNNWKDRDRGWSAEMAVPVADLTEHGDAFGPGSEWHILTGRYNYSVHREALELSSFPTLQKQSFHLLHQYAVLEFE